jgi:hypothetical protein
MQINTTINRIRFAALFASAIALTAIEPNALASPRPISDFLSSQGHWCVAFDNSGNAVCPSTYGALGCGFLFVPPVANYIGWGDPKANIGMSMDYAGLADIAVGGVLDTTISGSVDERPLADGRAQVEVVLHTENALSWAQVGFDYNNGQLLFGVRARDVLNGATPSLGNCTLKVRFINSAPGAPLPDLIELLFCRFQDLQVLSIYGQASGFLADGSPGRAEVVQTGLIQTSRIANPTSRVALDAYPAEHVRIQATSN